MYYIGNVSGSRKEATGFPNCIEALSYARHLRNINQTSYAVYNPRGIRLAVIYSGQTELVTPAGHADMNPQTAGA